MRVVVVGATGNSGTAVLRALAAAPDIGSVLGIARRLPDTGAVPYSMCEWAAIDIAAASTADEAMSRLVEAFAGADAVVHLAWLTQPDTDRQLLRRVNQEGTARVARAVAEAGVPHLVVASAAGVYSPGCDLRRRDESWPARGVHSSRFSVDKVEQERVLDAFESEHPDVVLTRMRPALVLQAEAASKFERDHLGGWLPRGLLAAATTPRLLLPKGLRGIQVVQADDLGRAYCSAVTGRVAGAFNVCADDLLGPRQLADILDDGRFVELPLGLFRTMLRGAHRTNAMGADADWLDLAMYSPLLDNSRAKTMLGWEPRYTAAEALTELLQGIREGAGGSSLPLRPRDPDRAVLAALGGSPEESTGCPATERSSASAARASARAGSRHDDISEKISRDQLDIYLSDHLTGATAGANRIRRMADDFIDTPVFAPLSELAEQIRVERAFLQHLIDDLRLRRRRHRQFAAWTAERLGRLKGNGRVLSRAPLTLVLESELMRSAVIGKLGMWQTLRAHAEELDLDPQVFDRLADLARDQAAALDTVHEYARERAFRTDRKTFGPGTTG